MDAISVSRWRRYGHDRLYVEREDGERLGHWDLRTGTAHPAAPELEDVVRAAAEAWCRENDVAPVPVAEVAEVVEQVEPVVEPDPPAADPPEPAPVVEPWVDLATNRPGAEARDRADAAFVAAPVRTTLARVLGVHTSERAWRIGADGEEKVAAQLAKVARKDPRWRFLHAIPVGTRGSDIDHLAIGPGGVFTINAKHHPGAKVWVGGSTVMVDGARVPYVRNARHEATRAGQLLAAASGLEVPVRGVVAVVRAGDLVVKAQPDGVTVLPRMQVASWLLRHGEVFDAATCEAFFEAARRSTTWR